MSPERMMATASAALTTLSRTGLSPDAAAPFLVALGEPVDDALADDALRLAGDEDADMPARQSELGIVLRAQLAAQHPHRRRRDDVVVLGVDVQHRHGEVA